MDEVAQLAGLAFSINLVSNEARETAGLFCGEVPAWTASTTSLRSKSASSSKAPGAVSRPRTRARRSGRRRRRSGRGVEGEVVGAEAAHRDAADRQALGGRCRSGAPRAGSLRPSPSCPSRHRRGRASSCGRRRPERRRPGRVARQAWQATEDGVVEGPSCRRGRAGRRAASARPSGPGRRHDHVDAELPATALLRTSIWTSRAPWRSTGANTVAARTR